MKVLQINTPNSYYVYISVILLSALTFLSFGCSEDVGDDLPQGSSDEEVDDNSFEANYIVVDTDQEAFYNNTAVMNEPGVGEAFYGQDAMYEGHAPSYIDNGNATITDMNTGLMWMANLPDEKYNYSACVNYADSCSVGGYDDWRLPTVKELYSLILFSGRTGETSVATPYINTEYFEFRYGDVFGGRDIDAQYVTSSIYTSTTMDGNETMFGVNFADGRIKGYPTNDFKTFEIKLVRGHANAGVNNYVDNGDNTITDKATGLMWDETGSVEGMNWEEALAYAQEMNTVSYLGYSDWRLPNAKELHTLVDYSRSPDHTNSAAIDAIFTVPEILNEGGVVDYPWYWTSTTHYDGPSPNKAVYVCFGRAIGYWSDRWQDVHGAGAQRSDPKVGDPNDYPTGFGPQGDAIRIFNYVRLVRDNE